MLFCLFNCEVVSGSILFGVEGVQTMVASMKKEKAFGSTRKRFDLLHECLGYTEIGIN